MTRTIAPVVTRSRLGEFDERVVTLMRTLGPGSFPNPI